MTRFALLLVAVALAVLAAVALFRATNRLVFERGHDGHPLEHDEARPPSPENWSTLLDLSGTWDFRLGDRLPGPGGEPAGADEGWAPIAVPAAWEDQGYPGYDGYAWYRTTFALDAKQAGLAGLAPPFLLLGRIDDADEVWLNGTFLGWGGRMPPVYQTAAFGFRTYRIPPGLLRTDAPNELTVRVYDAGLEGGILEGPVALAQPTRRNPESVPLVADLTGTWRFAPGDALANADPTTDDAHWAAIRVPGTWEPQGYPDLTGIAWYRTAVTLSAEAAAQDLVLVLGAIDDLDETFVNGVRVGATGDVDAGLVRGDEWEVERAYPVPASVLRPGENIIAVRVFDGPLDGGIYRGPVALMTPEAVAERARLTPRDDW